MNTIDIFTLWEKSNSISGKKSSINEGDIEDFFKPRLKKNTLPLKFNIYLYLIMQFAGLIISSYDISLFLSNSRMLIVVSSFIMVFTLGLVYGIHLLFKIDRTDYNSLDLSTSIRSRLKLYKLNFEFWLWLCSASVVILPLAIVFIPDSENGTYIINNIPRFVLIELIIFFGIYLLNKLSLFRAASDLKTYYSDLIESTVINTEKKEKWQKKYRVYLFIFFLVLMIILVAFALKGLILFNNF